MKKSFQSNFINKRKLVTPISSAPEGKKMIGCEISGKSLKDKTTLVQHIGAIQGGDQDPEIPKTPGNIEVQYY